MNPIIFFLLVAFLISSMLLTIPLILSFMSTKLTNKCTSFECGASTISIPRLPFSIRFFMLMILFLIFDVEIALLMGLPLIIYSNIEIFIFMMLFLTILFLGLIYEWLEGSLNWKI